MIDNNVDIDELITACRARDDAAFAELIRRYTPLVNKLISEFGIDFLNSDELFSEGCAALYQAALSYDFNNGNVTFGLYARVCISHRFVDIKRKAKTVPELAVFDVENVEGEERPDRGLFERERFEAMILYARNQLSDYEYAVLLLHIQGYKTAAIAERLGKSPKSVDNAKARLFKRLRSMADSI